MTGEAQRLRPGERVVGHSDIAIRQNLVMSGLPVTRPERRQHARWYKARNLNGPIHGFARTTFQRVH